MGEESRHALIIANDRYADEGLTRLRAPAHDAVALARVLGDPGVGGFDVDIVKNEPAHVIARHIDDFFADRKTGDTLLVHFSCHGLKSESGELYFAARDTLPRRLDSTAVAADFVRRRMASTRARRVALFLDCCYGGAFAQGPVSVRAAGDVNVLDNFAGEKLGGGRGWAVITASTSMEYAFEGADLAEDAHSAQPSLFTHAVVQGLETGEADLDEDGRVSLDELYEYVFDRVRQQNPNQTPSRTVDMQGDMYLAHSRRRRIVPAALPDDVRAAMRSRDFYTRLGAIAELRARMENPDLAVALGAREALEEMARKDIRLVADEASRSLSEVAVNPYPTRVDFGPVPQGSPSPHRTVRLLGPPLARSCAPHPKAQWLNATETSDGLDVRVDTASPGLLSGNIVLKGVVGEAVLHVEAEVVPARERERPTEEKAETGPGPTPGEQTQTGPAPGADPHADAGTAAPTVVIGRPGTGAPPPPRPDRAPVHEAPPRPDPESSQPTRPYTPPPPPPRRPVPPPKQPVTPPPSATRRTGRPAAVLAGLAAALAAVALYAVLRAVVDGGESLRTHWGAEASDHLGHIRDTALVRYLWVSLCTAVAALSVGAYARHDLGAHADRYVRGPATATRLLCRTAKTLAVPALVLAVLTGIGYLVAAQVLEPG